MKKNKYYKFDYYIGKHYDGTNWAKASDKNGIKESISFAKKYPNITRINISED